MDLAAISVDSHIGKLQTYTYSIPDNLDVSVGNLVWVPFGRRILQGIVVRFESTSTLSTIKPILRAENSIPLIEQTSIEIGIWISAHYKCSLFNAISLFISPGSKSKISYSYAIEENGQNIKAIPDNLSEIYKKLSESKSISESNLFKLVGSKESGLIQQLVNQKLITKFEQYPKPMTPSYVKNLILNTSLSDRLSEINKLNSKGLAALEYLESADNSVKATELSKRYGPATVKKMLASGLVGLQWAPVSITLDLKEPLPKTPITLNDFQSTAVTTITQTLDSDNPAEKRYLLHGVTGSGKTEVYIRIIQEVIASGKQIIFLVPEIPLATQTLEQLEQRFPGNVCILHSNLSPRKRFEVWQGIRNQQFSIIIGPRSALFSPIKNLGLIVMDEEHEWNYKQHDIEPFYHARTVSLQLCQKNNATLILGSATPSIETFYNATTSGFYKLLSLPHRAHQIIDRDFSDTSVEVIDMRQELTSGNSSIFSNLLTKELETCVSSGKQAILFLNRRGSASIVSCRECGTKVTCPSCSTVMTYHMDYNNLVCHTCTKKTKFNETCKACQSNQVRTLGVGTKRVVDEITKLMPGTVVDRWDSDVSPNLENATKIYNDFKTGKTQILVGTQIIAKGLDIANVSLVGAMLADVGINLPDFRASEQWFTTLYQVIGRAGRDGGSSKAIIQTFQPDHPLLSLLKNNDYINMYKQEIQTRYSFRNPPFSRLAHLVFTHVNNATCQKNAQASARQLRDLINSLAITDIEIIGPAPGLPKKTRGKYRWHILVRGNRIYRLLDNFKPNGNCILDIDPIHVL
jgi:primosomal protein N' (replication factor Y)